MELILIAAVAANGVIGRGNRIPWQIPGELTRFKEITMGHVLIMGRKTWDSLARPLPGRRNIVVTRDIAFTAPGAEVAHSLQEAIAAAGPKAEKIFVIGGEQIYSVALDKADALLLSRLDQPFDGDAFFPPFPSPPFLLIHSERVAGPLPYTVETWRRTGR
ncbi:dihydrofolate reductase [Candidatus Electronema sp. JC]|jgi:dihydrofolate reductase|uniref:dihydrofolate reductase n=1 Tax=Candidatus Electronema sp. JC TaxID=3401570 RepID=UPI003B430732